MNDDVGKASTEDKEHYGKRSGKGNRKYEDKENITKKTEIRNLKPVVLAGELGE